MSSAPEIFLALGPDEFLLREHLDNYKTGATKKYGDFSVSTVSFLDIPLSELQNEVFSPPFFGGKRVLFLSHFPPAASPALSEEKRESYLSFVESLSDIPEGVVLIFSSATPDRRTKIFKEMEKIAKLTWKFESFDEKKDPHRFSEWIIERAKRYGGVLGQKEAEFLKNYAGHSLNVLDLELQKLALFCAGKTITQKDIESLSVPANEIADFAFSNAVASGRFSQVSEAFQDLTENFEAGMIWNRDILSVFRTLLKVKTLSLTKDDPKSLGLHPFVVSNMRNIANSVSEEKLLVAYKKLLEIDCMTKDGRLALTGNTDPFFLTIETLLHDIFGHQKK
ncbi:MAG: DNA polymerase III subunit delta [Candidatus Peregrinibacteria bacterium]